MPTGYIGIRDHVLLVFIVNVGINMVKSAYQQLKSQAKLHFYPLKKIRLGVLKKIRQRIHMKYQVLFSLKNNEKIFKTVVLNG